MKKFLSLAVLIGLMSAGQARADGPTTAPAQPAVATAEAGPMQIAVLNGTSFEAPRPLVKATWLGVSAVHAQPILLKQLRQKSGLVVAGVETGSPADQAGLKADDLITKLDDQLLINPEQLRDLIRLHDAGQSASVTLIREGQEMKLTAKLGEHQVVALADEDGAASSQFVKVYTGAEAFPATEVRTYKAFPATAEGAKDGTIRLYVDSVYSDHGRSFITSSKDGKKVLVVKDDKGNDLFNGPIDGAADLAKLPPELKEAFESMRKMEANVQPPPAGK